MLDPISGNSPIKFTSVCCELMGDQPAHILRVTVELESTRAHRPGFVAFDIVDHLNTPLMQAIPILDPTIFEFPRVKRLTA